MSNPLIYALMAKYPHLARGGMIDDPGPGPRRLGPPQVRPPAAAQGQQAFDPGNGQLGNADANSQNVASLSPISTFQAQGPQSNLRFQQANLDHSGYGNSVNQGMQQAQATGGQQSALAQALLNQANGNGVNLAQEQLKQATDRNLAQSFAMAQANGNDAGAQRQLANRLGDINQQAAGQSAQQRMQQQLAAQEQLAGVLGTQRGQDIGQFGTAGQLQNSQNQTDLQNLTDQEKLALQQNMANQNANLTAQGINAGTANNNAGRVANAIGQVVNAGGAAVSQWAGGNGQGSSAPSIGDTTTVSDGPSTGTDVGAQDNGPLIGDTTTVSGARDRTTQMANGGLVHALIRHYASGGDVDQFSTGIDAMLRQRQPVAPNPYLPEPAAAAKPEDHSAWGHKDTAADTILKALPGGALVDMAGRALGSGAEWLNHSLGTDKPVQFAGGGNVVPGRAPVKGDSPKNDRVPAVLSPGEIVLPRSVATSDDAPEKAKAFVAAIKKQKGQAKASSPKSFGELLGRVRDIRAQLADLEGQLKGGK